MADRLATVLTGYAPAARTAARTALAGVIQRAYTVGDNPLVTARQISRQFAGITYTRAATIARTEMGVAGWSRTQSQYANDPAVKSWQWFAFLDSKTCNICTSLHGREFPTSRRLETHPNCRCTMLPVTRNNRPIPAGETGVARMGGMDDAALRALWGPTRARLIREGADPLSLIGSRVHPVFGRQPVVKSLKQMGVSQTRVVAQRAAQTTRARYTSIDEMPSGVREAYARGAFDSVEGDTQLRALTDAQGFRGKPQVLTDAELDRFVADGETEFFRGVTKESYADRWLYGDATRHGTGYYGNGTYTAVGRGIEAPAWRQAQGYAAMDAKEVAEIFSFGDGVVMRGTLQADARVLRFSTSGTDLPRMDAIFDNLTDAERAMDSVTHIAASRGYDAVLVQGAERIGAETGGDQLIILNRGVTRMSSRTTAPRSSAEIREGARSRQ